MLTDTISSNSIVVSFGPETLLVFVKMEKNQDGQIDKDKFQKKQTREEKLHGEKETAECNEIGNREIENKEKDIQANTLSEVKDVVVEHSMKNSSAVDVENLHKVPSVSNLSDVYSSEKFGHDLLQFIEHGQSLENWHHGSYQDAATNSFSSHMHIESIPICPIQECINAEIQPTSESTLTLTVLNSTNTDEATQPISFSLCQPSTYGNNLVDHDYCTYPKSDYSIADNYHGAVNSSALMHKEQHEPGMDLEKLQRMKRRKEKNRECSRQFRLKQKNKEETLKNGKIEKIQNLESLRRNVENLKTTLSKVAAQCCFKCPKSRMLLDQFDLVNKENINPEYTKIMK